MPRPPSGLQRDVFKLYKSFLQLIRTKPEASRPGWYQYVQHQFRVNGARLGKRDVAAIEYSIRQGKKMLEVYQSPHIKNVAPVSEDHYPLGWVAASPDRSLPRKTKVTIDNNL